MRHNPPRNSAPLDSILSNQRNWPTSLPNNHIPNNFVPSDSTSQNAALELSPVPVLFCNLADLTVEWANPAAFRFLQIGKQQLAKHVLADFVPERELPGLWQTMADLQKGQKQTASTLLSAEDGIGLCRFTIAKTKQHILAIGQVGNQASQYDANYVHTDALTGLPDRRALQTKIDAALDREHNNWGLLFVDLNRYKQINDQYGHVAGDRVLAEFAQKLKASSRPNDLVVRYGGDEFVVFVDRIPTEVELRAMASRVAREVSVMVRGSDRTIVITGSVGCAMATSETETAQQIIAAADRDMYLRKRKAS